MGDGGLGRQPVVCCWEGWVGEVGVEEMRGQVGGRCARRSMRSPIGWDVLCVEETVDVSPTDDGLPLGRPLGWCGTAAGRGKEARACATQVGDDVVDDGAVSEKAHDAQAARTGGAAEGIEFEDAAEQLGPGEATGAGSRGVIACGASGWGVSVGGEALAAGAAGAGGIRAIVAQLVLAGPGDVAGGAAEG